MDASKVGLLLGFLLTALVGCASDVSLPPPAMQGPSVTLDAFDTGLTGPPVAVGDVFVYDNPVERMEVVAVGTQFIDYQDGQGGFAKTTWSPILPKLRWGSTYSAGNRTLTKITGKLHPLAKGNRIVFREDAVRGRPGVAYESTWECEVQDRLEITVKAGSAETWQILCRVNGRDRAVLSYSEKIGGLVRMIYALDNGSTLVRQLTGYGRSSGARPATGPSAEGRP